MLGYDWCACLLQEYFGTSRGFGFTKKNELFVGRVAMLVSLSSPSVICAGCARMLSCIWM